ncbi:hypothetical protein JRI60_44280 [Archangium violaceum]|uniref:hypothetical protein n=1 Tax=Archangium violaceum TaxID=83451 RepID=UPI00194F47FE|nr:hypothetical protein [Archangium violaceum]QRN95980.1 hypothetical protein JRI60_44280 [Archangium violaceum]
MRPILILAALSLLCACPSGTPPPTDKPGETPPTGLPAELKPPTSQERPPTGPGLPSDLKPPGH